MPTRRDSASTEPIIMIPGTLVGLGPVNQDHLPVIQRWFNDPLVTRGLGNVGPFSMEDEQQWYATSERTERHVTFAIYEMSTGRPVGNCDLHNVDRANQRAEVGIAIGDKTCWNKGYGTEAVTLLLDYAFNIINLTNVMLIVYAYNARAQRAYEKVGFKVIGRRRSARLHGGKHYDEIYMDVIASEFKSPYLAKLFAQEDASGAGA